MPVQSPVIYLVYDASGTVLGEAAYFAKKWLGIASCSLCTVTHRGLKVRPRWAAAQANLGVQVRALHRNELDAAQQMFIDGALPCVVAQVGSSLQWLLRPEEIEPFVGQPEALAAAIQARVAGLDPATQ